MIQTDQLKHLTKAELRKEIKKIRTEPCPMCRTTGSIEFHHVDPSTKKLSIGNAVYQGKNTLLIELVKVTPLCHGCHKFVDVMIGSREEKHAYPSSYYLGGNKERLRN